MNILFICSRNQWRSPTAEEIYKAQNHYNVKSAGTEPSARIKVTAKLIRWADIIFAMEKRHKQRIVQNFPSDTDTKRIVVLDIPDEYQYMDEELIETIKLSVEPYLDNVKKADKEH
jgi:protein-tyrosine phosphatase